MRRALVVVLLGVAALAAADGEYACRLGFGWDAVNGTCQDVDECVAGTHDCVPGAPCTNVQGSFVCACADSSYIAVPQGNGASCVDEKIACSGWHYFNGSFFLVPLDHELGWHDAQAACNSAGGQLASIIDEALGENILTMPAFLLSLLKAHGKTSGWIGGHRSGPSVINIPAQRLSQIQQSEDGHCIELSGTELKDLPCKTMLPFVCQADRPRFSRQLAPLEATLSQAARCLQVLRNATDFEADIHARVEMEEATLVRELPSAAYVECHATFNNYSYTLAGEAGSMARSTDAETWSRFRNIETEADRVAVLTRDMVGDEEEDVQEFRSRCFCECSQREACAAVYTVRDNTCVLLRQAGKMVATTDANSLSFVKTARHAATARRAVTSCIDMERLVSFSFSLDVFVVSFNPPRSLTERDLDSGNSLRARVFITNEADEAITTIPGIGTQFLLARPSTRSESGYSNIIPLNVPAVTAVSAINREDKILLRVKTFDDNGNAVFTIADALIDAEALFQMHPCDGGAQTIARTVQGENGRVRFILKAVSGGATCPEWSCVNSVVRRPISFVSGWRIVDVTDTNNILTPSAELRVDRRISNEALFNVTSPEGTPEEDAFSPILQLGNLLLRKVDDPNDRPNVRSGREFYRRNFAPAAAREAAGCELGQCTSTRRCFLFSFFSIFNFDVAIRRAVCQFFRIFGCCWNPSGTDIRGAAGECYLDEGTYDPNFTPSVAASAQCDAEQPCWFDRNTEASFPGWYRFFTLIATFIEAGLNIRDQASCEFIGCCWNPSATTVNKCMAIRKFKKSDCPAQNTLATNNLALRYDRSDGLIITDNLAASGLAGSFTLSAQVQLDSMSADNTIFSTRTNDASEIEKIFSLSADGRFVADLLARTLHCFVRANGQVVFRLGYLNSSHLNTENPVPYGTLSGHYEVTTGPFVLTQRRWYHIAFSYNAETGKPAILVDGVERTNALTTPSVPRLVPPGVNDILSIGGGELLEATDTSVVVEADNPAATLSVTVRDIFGYDIFCNADPESGGSPDFSDLFYRARLEYISSSSGSLVTVTKDEPFCDPALNSATEGTCTQYTGSGSSSAFATYEDNRRTRVGGVRCRKAPSSIPAMNPNHECCLNQTLCAGRGDLAAVTYNSLCYSQSCADLLQEHASATACADCNLKAPWGANGLRRPPAECSSSEYLEDILFGAVSARTRLSDTNRLTVFVYDVNPSNLNTDARLIKTVTISDLVTVAPSQSHSLVTSFTPDGTLRYTTQIGCSSPLSGIGCRTRVVSLTDGSTQPKLFRKVSLRGQVRNPTIYGDAVPGTALRRAMDYQQSVTGGVGVAQTHNRVVLIPNIKSTEVAPTCNTLSLTDTFMYWRELDTDCEADDTNDCYEYFAGWANDLPALTKIEVRASTESYQYRQDDKTPIRNVDAWIPVSTTCGCRVEDASGTLIKFRPVQTISHVSFELVDGSGCEEGFNFARDGENLEEEFSKRLECFEQVFTDRAGDSLGARDEELQLKLGVGKTFEYCARAVGPSRDADTVYESDAKCANVTIEFVTSVGASVATASGVPVAGASITGLLLTFDEKTNGRRVRELQFVHTGQTPRRRRFVFNGNCSAEPALDELDRPLYASWPSTRATEAGTTATLACPRDRGSVSRTCRADGSWGPVSGACFGDLDRFASAPGFLAGIDTALQGPFRGMTVDTCAWKCLHESPNCFAFEYTKKTSVCILVATPGSLDAGFLAVGNALATLDDAVALLQAYAFPAARAVSVFEDQTVTHFLTSNRSDIPAVSPLLTPPSFARICSVGSVNDTLMPVPHDKIWGNYLSTREQMASLDRMGCDYIRGNLVVRCDQVETCRQQIFRMTPQYLCRHPAQVELDQNLTQLCPAGLNGPAPADAVLIPRLAALRASYNLSIFACPVTYSPRLPVTSLAHLRRIRAVAGVVSISDCPALERFDGGLGRLEEIAGIFNDRSLTIANNPILTGGLPVMLGRLAPRHFFGDVQSNPLLCTGAARDWLADWAGLGTAGGNAPPEACGCTNPQAANFDANLLASIDDGTCVAPQCAGCAPGTSGPCSLSLGGETICMPLINQTWCPAAGTSPLAPVTFCDLCANVLCNNPPPCFTSASTCINGSCVYEPEAKGTRCDDGDATTGPDECSGTGVCEGLSTCNVFERTGVASADFGGAVVTDAHMRRLEGCIVIEGDLHVDCALPYWLVPPTPAPGTLPPTTTRTTTTVRIPPGQVTTTTTPRPTTAPPNITGPPPACPLLEKQISCYSFDTGAPVVSHFVLQRQCCFPPRGSKCRSVRAYPPLKSCRDITGKRLMVEQVQECRCEWDFFPLTTTTTAATAPTTTTTPAPDPVTFASILRLGSLRTITGSLTVQNCPVTRLGTRNSTSSTGLGGLTSILGARGGHSVILANNPDLAGSVPGNLPSLERVAGGVSAANNTRLCDNVRAWNAEWLVSNNAPANTCGCTDPRALNYAPGPTIDDDSCDIDLCVKPTPKTCPVRQCYVSTCVPETADCVYEPLDVQAAGANLTCDDGRNWTVGDTCETDPALEQVNCSGVDICVAEPEYCPVKTCQVLRSCSQGVCAYDLLDDVPCSDGLDYTLGDTCIAGECVGILAPCYQPGLDPAVVTTSCRPRALEVRLGSKCELNSSQVVPRPGDLFTFDLWLPNASLVSSLQLEIMGQNLLSLDPAFALDWEAAVGHWEVEYLPNRAFMLANCAKACFEEALVRVLRGTSTLAQEYMLNSARCGVPGKCNENFVTPCQNNTLTDRVCAHFVNTGQCTSPSYQLAVRQLSHRVRDEIYDFEQTVPISAQPFNPATAVARVLVSAAPNTDPLDGSLLPDVVVQNFDIRHHQSVVSGVTDDRGAVTFDLIAPVSPNDDDPTVQLVQLSPFAVTRGARHVFSDPSDPQQEQFCGVVTTVHIGGSSGPTFVDNSSFVVSGRITLGNHPDSTVLLADSANCPVVGAEVCATDRVSGQQLGVCGKTDVTGAYQLTVNIGSNVLLAITADGRVFEPVYSSETATELANVISDVPEVNFEETTVTRISLQFAGGACSLFIGQASFLGYSATENPACHLAAPLTVGADGQPFKSVVLPAQVYTFELQESSVAVAPGAVFGAGEVINFFRGLNTIQPAEDQAGLNRTVQFNATALASPQFSETARFEFRVAPTLELKIASAGKRIRRQDCLQQGIAVVDQGTVLNVRVLAEEVYLAGQVCLRVSGKVRLEEGVTGDSSANGDFELVTKSNGNTAVSSGIAVDIPVGAPNTNEPFTSEIRVQFLGYTAPLLGGWDFVSLTRDIGRVHAVVLVQGEVAIADGFAMKIPDYVPFAILRRPPGAESSAEYKVKHTAKLEAKIKTETKSSLEIEIKPATQAGTTTILCAAPLGFGPCVSSADVEAGIEFGGTTSKVTLPFISRTKEKTIEFSMGVETTLKTSEKGNLAGRAGDLFFSPTVSIKFAIFAVISVPDGICIGRRDEYERWSLVPGDATQRTGDLSAAEQAARVRLLKRFESGTPLSDTLKPSSGDDTEINRKIALWEQVKDSYRQEDSAWNAQALHSLYDILNVRIPELRERVANAERDLRCLQNFDPDTCPPLTVIEKSGGIQELEFRLQLAQAGLDGWKNTLKIYGELNKAAKQYPLDPRELFSSQQTGDGGLRNSMLRQLRTLRNNYRTMLSAMKAPTTAGRLEQATAIWKEAGLGASDIQALTNVFTFDGFGTLTSRFGIAKDLSAFDRNLLHEQVTAFDYISLAIGDFGELIAAGGALATLIPVVGPAFALLVASTPIFGTSTTGDYIQKVNTKTDPRNIISYNGGDSEMKFEVTTGNKQEKSDTDHLGFNTEVKFAGVQVEFEIFGFGFKFDFEFKAAIEHDEEREFKQESEAEEATSFTLKDSILGDSFDVAIFRDPVYNTLVYETVSGRSMCPHEEGTVPREQIELVYEGGIKSQTLQATSERVVAEIILRNKSPTKESWFYKIQVNPIRGLTFMISGWLIQGIDGWTTPYVPAGGEYRIEIEVYRNEYAFAGDDVFEGIEIFAVSPCEYDLNNGDGVFLIDSSAEDPNDWTGRSLISSTVTLNLRFPPRTAAVSGSNASAPGSGAPASPDGATASTGGESQGHDSCGVPAPAVAAGAVVLAVLVLNLFISVYLVRLARTRVVDVAPSKKDMQDWMTMFDAGMPASSNV